MNFITNPWFIFFTVLNILFMIYFGIKLYHKPEKPFSLLKKLHEQGIFPTLRKPFKSPQEEEPEEENGINKQNNNT